MKEGDCPRLNTEKSGSIFMFEEKSGASDQSDFFSCCLDNKKFIFLDLIKK